MGKHNGEFRLPSKKSMAHMDLDTLYALAPQCVTQDQLERLGTVILNRHGAWREGAHSEDPEDGGWQQRICGHEWNNADIERVGGVRVIMSESTVRRLIGDCTRAACTKRQAQAFVLTYDGYTPSEVARLMGITPQTAADLLGRAQAKWRDYVDYHGELWDVMRGEFGRGRQDGASRGEPIDRATAVARFMLEEVYSWQTQVLAEDPKHFDVYGPTREWIGTMTAVRGLQARAKTLSRFVRTQRIAEKWRKGNEEGR